MSPLKPQEAFMSELNPYDKYLDGRPVQEILAATPATLAGLIDRIGAEKSTRPPAPGKWSPAEIVCHLADCELVFAFRLRQTLAEDGYIIQPFDQGKWGAQYGGISAAQALGVFSALRGWNLQLLRGVAPEAAGRTVTHPERGAMTFQTIVETMAGHDLNHIGQLKGIAGQNG
jgi:DinB superfamily